MKKTLAVLFAVFVLAIPVGAEEGRTFSLGISGGDAISVEAFSEIAFGYTSSVFARGLYSPDNWQIGAGWRDYAAGNRLQGIFVGAFLLYDSRLKDVNLGVDLGYRHNFDRWFLEAAVRAYGTAQPTKFNLMMGMPF